MNKNKKIDEKFLEYFIEKSSKDPEMNAYIQDNSARLSDILLSGNDPELSGIQPNTLIKRILKLEYENYQLKKENQSLKKRIKWKNFDFEPIDNNTNTNEFSEKFIEKMFWLIYSLKDGQSKEKYLHTLANSLKTDYDTIEKQYNNYLQSQWNQKI